MIEYLGSVKPLEEQGLDSATIAAHLASRTASPMIGEEAKYILEDTGAVLLDPVVENQRMGSLISYYQGLPEGEAKQLIAWFISRVFSGQNVGTDEYPRSVQFSAVEKSLPENLKPIAERLVQSAGGRPYANTVESDIAAAKQDYADQLAAEEAAREVARQEEEARQAEQQAREEEMARRMEEEEAKQVALMQLQAQYTRVYNSNIAPLIDGQSVDSAAWKAAIQTMADSWVISNDGT
jgi:Skp family chaperone for outer membrane proteins